MGNSPPGPEGQSWSQCVAHRATRDGSIKCERQLMATQSPVHTNCTLQAIVSPICCVLYFFNSRTWNKMSGSVSASDLGFLQTEEGFLFFLLW